MRITHPFLCSLLLLPFIGALSHRHGAHKITLRQHRQRRALLDVCVFVDATVISESSVLGPLDIFSDLNICLCLSTLPLFISTNVEAQALVDIWGESAVTALLTTIINTAQGSQQCDYPPHATPACSSEDVCGFSCESPYVEVGRTCQCQLPNKICNGQCGTFRQGCGSALPRSVDDIDSNVRIKQTVGVTSLADAQATCTEDYTVCGVLSGTRGFECLNTETNLESCGGCMYAHPFLPSDIQNINGIDCSALDGVSDVECQDGRCSVHRCKSGYNISSEGDTCVEVGTTALLRLDNRMKPQKGPSSSFLSNIFATLTAYKRTDSATDSVSSDLTMDLTDGTLDSTYTVLDADTSETLDDSLSNVGLGDTDFSSGLDYGVESGLDSTATVNSNSAIVGDNYVRSTEGLTSMLNSGSDADVLSDLGSSTTLNLDSTQSSSLGSTDGLISDPSSLLYGTDGSLDGATDDSNLLGDGDLNSGSALNTSGLSNLGSSSTTSSSLGSTNDPVSSLVVDTGNLLDGTHEHGAVTDGLLRSAGSDTASLFGDVGVGSGLGSSTTFNSTTTGLLDVDDTDETGLEDGDVFDDVNTALDTGNHLTQRGI